MHLNTAFQLSIAFLVTGSSLYAQSPSIEWQKCFGGSFDDGGEYVIQTSDGGYIACGTSVSNDGDVTGNHLHYDSLSGNWVTSLDIWIVKSDAWGNIQWQKSLGGSANEWIPKIIQTSDGGYAVIGTTGSDNGDITFNQGNIDVWLVRLDSSGNITWQKTYGSPAGEGAFSILQTADSGFVFAGYALADGGDVSGHHGILGADFWVVKVNSTGNIEWQKCLGGTGDEGAASVIQLFTGEFIVTGQTTSSDGDLTFNHGSWDYWIVKLDSLGGIIWQKTYGGTAMDEPQQVVQALDSNIFVIGFTTSNNGDVSGLHGNEDYWCIKIDTAGNLIWQKTLGGTGFDYGYSVDKTSDGGCIVAGGSNSVDGDVTFNFGSGTFAYWIAKLNSQGQLQWQKTFGGQADDFAKCIKQTSDDGFIMNGQTYSNDFDVSGLHDSIPGTFDYWVVKLSAYTGINEIDYLFSNILVYPNPSDGNVTIHFNDNTSEKNIQIFDVTGNIIYEKNKITNSEVEINLTASPKGIYFLKVITEDKITAAKILIL